MNKQEYINSEIAKAKDFQKKIRNQELKADLSEEQLLTFKKYDTKLLNSYDEKINALTNLSDEDFLLIQETDEAFKKFAESNNLTVEQLLDLSDDEYDELLKQRTQK